MLCPPASLGGACDGGSCVPQPTTGEICVFHSGPTVACPPGYPNAHRIFSSAEVVCDACSCDAPTGTPNCALLAPIQFFSDGTCGSFVGSISSTGCTNGISGAGSAVYLPVDPGSCNPRSASTITRGGGTDVCCL